MRLQHFIIIAFLISIALIISCKQNSKNEVVVGNGKKIPIDACVEVNTKILGKSVDPVAFCKCMIPKFYEVLKDDPDKLDLLNDGKFDQASIGQSQLVATFYSECMSQSGTGDSTARLTITPKMEADIRQGVKDAFEGTDFEKTNDIDAYCDCLVKGMQTELTPKEIMQSNTADSIKFERMREKCILSSRRTN
jgi:hypothetical protein